jgi:uncharacterized radical SAM superfamily Fe-S cluster-containing enzyme
VQAVRSQASVYVVVPVMRGTLEDLEPLIDWMVAASAVPRGLLLAVPQLDEMPSGARKLTVPFDEVAAVAAKVFRKCHDLRMEYGFDGPQGIAPCASRAVDRFGTVFHDRVAHHKRSPDIELRRIAACDECSLRHTCRGIEPAYLDTHGAEGFAPVPLDVSMDWKLRPLNRLEAREFKNVSDFANEAENPRSLLRINGHCNMSCAFCFVDRTAPDFPAEELEREIARMRTGNELHLVLSGGEPTLHPELEQLVEECVARPIMRILINTNEIELSRSDRLRSLLARHRDRVEVHPQYGGSSAGGRPSSAVRLRRFKDAGRVAGDLRPCAPVPDPELGGLRRLFHD